MSEPNGTTYVVAELNSDGRPVSYLRSLAAHEFGPDVTYRLTIDPDEAARFLDKESAQKQADRFNSSPHNPQLMVTVTII